MYQYLLCFGFFVATLLASAQVPHAVQYGVETGLPSLEAYQVRTDSKGYVWVVTDRGVSRFDGTAFITYSQKDGLENLTILAMAEDNHGRMWFASIKNTLYYFENNRFHPFEANQQLAER